MKKRYLSLAASISAAIHLFSGQTLADEGFTLEEIVVTAQKRSENVQDLPVAVTAMSADMIESASITTVRELSRFEPTLQIGQATGTVTTFIRGIGNPVTTAGNEASVPIYIDDVYFIRAGFPFFDMANLERVEILKGPQGTLFGRNATGGVISLHTKDPSFDVAEGKVKIGYGNYDTTTIQFYGSTPITENLAADISFSSTDQRGGWGKNLFNGKEAFRNESSAVRTKWVWTPTETTNVELIGFYQDSHSEQGIYSKPFDGTPGGSPNWLREAPSRPNPGSYGNPQPYTIKGFYDISMDTEQFDDSQGYGGSIRIEQEFSAFDFVSISAFRENDELYRSDGDYTGFDFKQYDLHIRDNQVSQEFQFKSKADADVNWILGLYYLSAEQGFDPTTIVGEAFSGAPDDPASGIGIERIDISGKQDVESYAAFGQVTYPFTENTSVTLGLRYTEDQLEGEGTTEITFLPGVFGPDPLTVTAQQFDANNDYGGANGVAILNGNNSNYDPSFDEITWRLAIDHHFSDDLMVYASTSRGYKSGTFNTLPLDLPALDPEIVDAYEIGVKSEFMDGRLRINGAIFFNDIDSPQVQAQRNGLVFLVNAGSAETKGIEFDASFAVTDSLTARVAATYLDAEFKEFDSAPTYRYDNASDPWCGANATAISGAPYPTCGQLVQQELDAKGNQMPYASDFKMTASLNYEHYLSDIGMLDMDLSVAYSSEYNWDADNLIVEPSRTLVDGSIAFTPDAAQSFKLRLWGKNLTGDEYNFGYYAQASGSAFSVSPGAPKTYGVEVLFTF